MKRMLYRTYRHSTTLFLVCSGIFVVVLFFILWVFPLQKTLENLDRDIREIKGRVELQEKLRPLYKQLQAREKSTLSEKLPVPQRDTLPKVEIDSVLPTLSEIGRKTKMEIISVNPDVTVLEKDPGSLLVNATIQGNFFDLRNFLIEMGKISYLEKIGAITINQSGAQKKVNLRIWLAVS